MNEEAPEMAETDLGDGAKVKHRKGTHPVRMTPEEKACLTGLVAARNAVVREIDGFVRERVCARLGIHMSRIVNADTDAGIVLLASDAPKE